MSELVGGFYHEIFRVAEAPFFALFFYAFFHFFPGCFHSLMMMMICLISPNGVLHE